MPKSKGRRKTTKRRYELHPHRKQRTKSSPRWFAPVMLLVMGAGAVVVVWNFLRSTPDPGVMWLGLGLIAAGLFGISFWR